MSKTACSGCGNIASEEEILLQFEKVLNDYEVVPGSLIPLLQIAQRMIGYLPEIVIKKIAEKLDKSYSEVAGVISFYSFFSTKPRGKFLVRVCLGTACYVRGGNEVLSACKKYLGIDVGQTTEDRVFSLDVGRCFGACGLAPVMMINDDVHQRVKSSKMQAIFDSYRQSLNEERGN